MNFEELVKRRYSVRKYKSDPVSDDLLHKVLQAAQFAPTAVNRQPFQLIVIRTPERRAELARVTDQEWVTEAPIVIAAVADPSQAWDRSDGKNFVYVDVAIVVDHITLAAAELGLGTCWIGGYNVALAREFLELPPGIEPVVFLPLGYPADVPQEKERKPLTELVRYERW